MKVEIERWDFWNLVSGEFHQKFDEFFRFTLILGAKEFTRNADDAHQVSHSPRFPFRILGLLLLSHATGKFRRNFFSSKLLCNLFSSEFLSMKKKLLRASHWNVWSLIILCWRRLKPKYVAVIDRTRFARSSTYKRTNKWKKNRHTNDYS